MNPFEDGKELSGKISINENEYKEAIDPNSKFDNGIEALVDRKLRQIKITIRYLLKQHNLGSWS